MAVTLTNHGLDIDGQSVPVYSGSVHYWRLERALWPRILDEVKALGFGMVETYIPWSIHEIEAGSFDFGQIDPRKDVEAFMRLCEEKGLWLIVRPGPLINAELTDFGFPERVLLMPEVQARTAGGGLHLDAAWGLHPPHQYPVPSYASERFFAETAGWFDAICPIMVRHLAPAGCIVTVQSDNETCYLFHDQTYATDYSDDSLALYRTFLQSRYGAISSLNGEYRTAYRAFSDVEPPRDCGIDERADLPLHLDWALYKEFQIRWAIARFAAQLRERGVAGVPIFHDVAYQRTTPLDVSRMEAEPGIDWVGMNMYCNKEDYQTVARRMRFLAGATKLPFVPEFGCGLWSHHKKTFEPHEHEFVTLAAYMHGLKALNYYMLVERERWQGSPITRHGTTRPDYVVFFQRFGEFLRRYPLWEFERRNDTLLLFNYDLSRHNAITSTLHLAHADLLGLPAQLFEVAPSLDLARDPRAEAEIANPASWLGEVGRSLTGAGVDFNYADTHVPADALGRYRRVWLQSTEFMDPEDQIKLVSYVESGGHLLVGPDLPGLDPRLQPNHIFQRFLDGPGTTEVGQGSITLASPDLLPKVLKENAEGAQFQATMPVETAVLTRGEQALLFVANPTGDQLRAELQFSGTYRLDDVWDGSGCVEATESCLVELRPYSIRIFEVTARD